MARSRLRDGIAGLGDGWQLPAYRLMTSPSIPRRNRRIPRTESMKRTPLIAATVLAVGLLSGCGHHSTGPSVARLGTSPSASAAPSAGGPASMLAYSQCMRTHGVPDFPDPDPDGRLTLTAHAGSDLDPNSATFKAADKACAGLRPAPNASQMAANRTQLLKYSKCMRSHGIPDFPDPGPDGGMQIQVKPGSDMDPNAPAFQAAQKACAAYQPGGAGNGPITDQNGPGGTP
jgi:hypothetical protein